jgi:hypothetical protein
MFFRYSFCAERAAEYAAECAAEYVAENHPAVKYYCYGTYFGARETMKRFKRKFGHTSNYARMHIKRSE